MGARTEVGSAFCGTEVLSDWVGPSGLCWGLNVRREASNMPETRSRGWLVEANDNALFDLTPIWERYRLEIRYMTWAVEKASPSRPRHVKTWF